MSISLNLFLLIKPFDRYEACVWFLTHCRNEDVHHPSLSIAQFDNILVFFPCALHNFDVVDDLHTL